MISTVTLLILFFFPLSYQTGLKILSMPKSFNTEGLPAPCALVCAGVQTSEGWKDSRFSSGKAFLEVDIAGCAFVSQPLITATVTGEGNICSSVFVDKMGSSLFTVYTVDDMTADHGKSERCEIHWSAFGYICGV